MSTPWLLVNTWTSLSHPAFGVMAFTLEQYVGCMCMLYDAINLHVTKWHKETCVVTPLRRTQNICNAEIRYSFIHYLTAKRLLDCDALEVAFVIFLVSL